MLPDPATPMDARDGTVVPGIRRRTLLQAAGGLAGGLLLGPAARSVAASAAPAGAPLREPSVIRSRGGVLETTLRVAPVTVDVDGTPRQMLAYNGEIPGPTLVAHPGDVLRIRLVNDLDTPTNLHTHGLHVSGEGNSDNIFIEVFPGESFDYEIELRHDHHTGTNWYHPHYHGTGAQQLFSGLFGALLVEPRGIDATKLGIARDRVLEVSAHEFGEDGQLVRALSSSQARQVPLLNGQLQPTIDLAPGETERWRFVNTSVNGVARLRLDGQTMTRVAADGSPYRDAVEIEELVLSSGQRADVLVTGNRAGSTTLRMLPYDIGFGVFVPERPLATVVTQGPEPRKPRRVNAQPLLQPFTDLRRKKVDVRRELSMTLSGGFGIDGKKFDHDRVDQWCELGAIEEWTVRNPTGLVHPFHIHVNPYQVTHVNGEPVDAQSYEDTTLIDKNGGSITFRTRFEHFLGTAIFHCHFVTHAELGMMGIAEIIESGTPESARRVAASAATPWNCTIPTLA